MYVLYALRSDLADRFALKPILFTIRPNRLRNVLFFFIFLDASLRERSDTSWTGDIEMILHRVRITCPMAILWSGFRPIHKNRNDGKHAFSTSCCVPELVSTFRIIFTFFVSGVGSCKSVKTIYISTDACEPRSVTPTVGRLVGRLGQNTFWKRSI